MSSKQLRGIATSIKNEKTAVIKVEVPKQHPVYEKRFVMHKKYQAHYGDIKVKEGDKVVIQECAPVSKNKTWIVKKVIK